MKKHMLIASMVALSGCLTTPQISEPSRPAAPATTRGGITATETPRHTQQAAEIGIVEGTRTHSAGAKDAQEETADAQTAEIDAWIGDACPKALGPALWSSCVQRQAHAIEAGLPSTEGLAADMRSWIAEACPRTLGPALWSSCVQRQINAVNAGLPSTERLAAEMRGWIAEACPRTLGPALWSSCVQRQVNAVNAGLPSTGRGNTSTARPSPANVEESATTRRETTPATGTETVAEDELEPRAPSRPPRDPAPHLPEPKNGERWLCGDGMSSWVLDRIRDGEMETPNSTIVLTRESPRHQARGTGKIAVAGVIHETHFEIEGISRRWDWNFDEEENATLDTFVIKGDGWGAYYDFRGVKGSTTPSELMECVQG